MNSKKKFLSLFLTLILVSHVFALDTVYALSVTNELANTSTASGIYEMLGNEAINEEDTSENSSDNSLDNQLEEVDNPLEEVPPEEDLEAITEDENDFEQENEEHFVEAFPQDSLINAYSSAFALTNTLEDIQQSAVFHKEYIGDDMVFNGTRVDPITLSADEKAKLQSLDKGSVIVRFKSRVPTTTTIYPVFFTAGKTIATNNNTAGTANFALLGMNNNATNADGTRGLRFDFPGNGSSRGPLTTGYGSGDGLWHTFIYTVDTTVGTSGERFFALDGKATVTTAGAGFFTTAYAPATTLDIQNFAIGGPFATSTTYTKFTGEIAFITITDKVLTQSEAAAISLPQYNLKATPRYSSIRLSWDSVYNATSYTIERSSEENGTFSVLASNVTTTSYIDETAGEYQTYYYRVKANNEKAFCAPVCNETPTGFQTIKDTAVFVKEYSSGEGTFNGTAADIVQLTPDQQSAFANLDKGTVIVKFKTTQTGGATYPVLVGAGNFGSGNTAPANGASTPAITANNAYISLNNQSTGNKSLRYDFPGDRFSRLGLPLTGYTSSNGVWHTFAYSADTTVNKTTPDQANGTKIVAFDGTASAQENGAGFFKNTNANVSLNPTAISIGGPTNTTTNFINFIGNIEYVIISPEYLTQSEMAAITTANVVTEITNVNAKPNFNTITLTWQSSVPNVAYQVLRSSEEQGTFTSIGTITSSTQNYTYKDTTAGEEATWFYKIKSSAGAESQVFTNLQPTGMQAVKDNSVVYIELSDTDKVFDGTKVLDARNKISDITALSNLTSGSVIVKYKPASYTSNNPVLVAMGSDSTTNYGAVLLTGSDANDRRIRTDFNGYRLNTGTTASYNYANQKWNTTVYSVNNSTSTNNLVRANNGLGEAISVAAATKFFLNDANFSSSGAFYNIGGHSANLAGSGGTGTAKFAGEIEYVLVTKEPFDLDEATAITKPTTSTKNDITKLFDDSPDNTWVFTGSSEISSSSQNIGGARTFIGHFEEYIRWNLQAGSVFKRQRYVINTAKAGLTVSEINDNFDTHVKKYKPKAVAVMVDKKDFSTDISSFKASLQGIVDKIYAMNAVPVFITPYKTNDASINLQIEGIINAMNAVASNNADILLVNIYASANTVQYLNSNNTINANGHLAVANELIGATCGGTFNPAGFGTEVVDKVVINANKAPTVTVGSDGTSLSVQMPSDYGSTVLYRYELTLDGTYSIKDTVNQKAFAINNLQADKSYVLKTYAIISSNNEQKLQTVQGVITAGNASTAIPHPEKGTMPSDLAAKWNSSAPMTWLFIGDSITHGAAHTYGYDSVPQLFEKFLAEEGRANDIIINAAVSSANASTGTEGTLNPSYKPYRLDRYLDSDPSGTKADVVVIMLGTNDAVLSGMTDTVFRTNIETIVNQVRAAGAIPILRAANPVNKSINSGTRAANMPAYIQRIREVASQKDVLLIDHFEEWTQLMAGDMPFLINTAANKTWLNDALHPNANGQLNMVKAIINKIGKYNENSIIANLSYKYSMIPTVSSVDVTQFITATESGFKLNVAALQAATAQTLDSATITVSENLTSQKVFSVTTKDMTATELEIFGLESNCFYPVKVSATHKTANDAGMPVTFATKNIQTLQKVDNTNVVALTTLITKPPFTVGSEYGTLNYSKLNVPQANVTYSLVSGAGDNNNMLFSVNNDKLVIKGAIHQGSQYTIRVRATVNGESYETPLVIKTGLEDNLIYYNREIMLDNVSKAIEFSPELFNTMKTLEDITVVVQFKQTNTGAYGALFSLSNENNANVHFNLLAKGSEFAMQIRGVSPDIDNKVGSAFPAPFKSGELNTLAFKAKSGEGYKTFVNGVITDTITKTGVDYKFVDDIPDLTTGHIGKTKRATSGTNADSYPFLGIIAEIKVYNIALDDNDLLEATSVTKKPSFSFEDNHINLFNAFMSARNTSVSKADNAGANYFRIPSLLSTKKGSVIAAIDARFGGTTDSANNIDITVRTRQPGSSTWTDAALPAYFGDFDNSSYVLPGSNIPTFNSASYIDPILLEDKTINENGRIFMMIDAFPSKTGNTASSPQKFVAGTGFISIDGEKKYWLLKKQGETGYNYYFNAIDVESDGMRTIYKVSDNTPIAEYRVNAMYELVKNGTALTVPQKKATLSGTTLSQTGFSGGNVPMNIMYDTADFTVLPTSYLYLFYSDDQGVTWSAPKNITGYVKPEAAESAFFGVGPGVGLQIKNGTYAGRLVFTVYGPSCRTIYSDDHGVTWNTGTSPQFSTAELGQMTESQIIELPDGSLRVFARTSNVGRISYATSLDGGATWSNGKLDSNLALTGGSGCQLSIINYSKLIDGKPAVILSSPTAASRTNGSIRIGLIEDTGKSGIDKYEIVWKYEKKIITNAPGVTGNDFFAYSCLTELSDGSIAILYENTNSVNPLEDAIRYAEYTLEDLTKHRFTPLNATGSIILASAGRTGSNYNVTVKLAFNGGVVMSNAECLNITYNGFTAKMSLLESSADKSEFTYTYSIPNAENIDFEVSLDSGTTIYLQSGALVNNSSILPLSLNTGTAYVPVERVVVNPETLSLSIGDEASLEADVYPENATNSAVVWSSSNESVATVNEWGVVFAVGQGSAIITASTVEGDNHNFCYVTVGANSSPADKESLNNIITLAESKTEADYTADSWAMLLFALDTARVISANGSATQEEVDNAYNELYSAISGLVLSQRIDKTALNSLIDTALRKVQADYTASSWAVFESALSGARAVSNNASATQTQVEVDNAYNELQSAISSLVLSQRIDKTALNSLIDTALRKVQADYTASSWAVFESALSGARAVSNNASATQTQVEVDNAYNELQSAISSLVLSQRIDKTALNSLIDTALRKVQADYTASSWAVFESALSGARAVSNNASATQTEIDNAKVALETAMRGLVAIPKPPVNNSTNTDESTDNSGTGNQSTTTLNETTTPAVESSTEKPAASITHSLTKYDDDNSTLSSTLTVQGTVKGSGVTAEISNDVVNKLIDESNNNLSNEINKGRNASIEQVIEINVLLKNGVNKSEITIPVDAVKAIANMSNAKLKVTMVASITFDKKALNVITSEAKSKITISSALLEDLTQAQKSALAEGLKVRPIYDFSVTNERGKVSDFKGGNAYVTVPYKLKPNENAGSVVLYHLSESGKLKPVQSAYIDGKVVARLKHFSNFIIGYNKVNYAGVPNDAWYKNAVDFAAARQVISTDESSKFIGGANITRAEFAAMLCKALDIQQLNTGENFNDASESQYVGYLAAIKQLGISSGVGGGNFAPNKIITREEMLTLLYSALNKVEGRVKQSGTSGTLFADYNDASDWSKNAINYFVENKVINGYNNRLYPKDYATKATAVQVIYGTIVMRLFL